MAFEDWAGIEDIDVIFIAQPFRFEHLARGQRVAMCQANRCLCVVGQHREVDGIARHQLGKE